MLASGESLIVELTDYQKTVLNKRLDAYKKEGDKGRPAAEVIADIKSRL